MQGFRNRKTFPCRRFSQTPRFQNWRKTMTSTNALTKFAPFSSTGVFQFALFCLALSSTAWAKPTFTLETTPNVCGGRLGVSGSGFPKGQVEFYANYQPTPKEQHPKRTEIGTATVGKDGLLSFDPQ